MLLFAPVKADVTVAPNMPAGAWDMKLLSADQITAQAQKVLPEVTAPLPTPTAAAARREACGNAACASCRSGRSTH